MTGHRHQFSRDQAHLSVCRLRSPTLHLHTLGLLHHLYTCNISSARVLATYLLMTKLFSPIHMMILYQRLELSPDIPETDPFVQVSPYGVH